MNELEVKHYSNLKKVLIISDLHGYLNIFLDLMNLEQPDLVLIAGDHQLEEQYLNEFKIVYVAGNNDNLGDEKVVCYLNDLKVGMTHGHKQYNMFHWHAKLEEYFKEDDVDLIIYGHSHKECVDKEKRPWIVNPGSIALPRNRKLVRTYVLLEFNQSRTTLTLKSF